ncbi:MAG TPA: aldehyde dehydrogenase family protein [Pseudobdellovibrionaceae bacterium]
MFQTINPATGEVIQTYNYLSLKEMDAIVERASRSFRLWREAPLPERAEVLRKLSVRFREHKKELAALMNQEMGKALEEGVAEIEKCAIACEYFAEMGAEFLMPHPMSAPYALNYPASYAHSEVRFEPLGIIFSIMPWNFPFWQFIRFAAPSIMIGNVILLKHANLTAGCGAKIEELCIGLWDEQIIFNLTLDHSEAARLIQNPKIRGVTFTGSTSGGREVAKTAGEALKKTVLELGGSDAYIIMADANIEKAAKICAQARMINHGQSCIAAKRFIVHKDVYDNFVLQMKAELSAYPTSVLASGEFQSQLQQQVEKMKKLGGQVLLGGRIPSGVGAFYPPTLIVFDKDDPEIHKEELFGPVALVLRAESVDEAFEIANSSPFGLGGGIFSGNAEKAQDLVAKRMEAGFVMVNDFVKSDPRLPFGGVKDSGYGRELGSFGFYEFCNVKTVVRGISFE